MFQVPPHAMLVGGRVPKPQPDHFPPGAASLLAALPAGQLRPNARREQKLGSNSVGPQEFDPGFVRGRDLDLHRWRIESRMSFVDGFQGSKSATGVVSLRFLDMLLGGVRWRNHDARVS